MNSRHQSQPHRLAPRSRSLTLWRIAVTVMGMMMAMAVMLPGSTNQVSRSGASVNNSDVPAASRSQVPESVATPQPWTGGTPSRVPDGVSTPPPFRGQDHLGMGDSTNSAPAPSPKKQPSKASSKTTYDYRTGKPVDQAIANGNVYQFKAKAKKVKFWKTDQPLDGVWMVSADQQTMIWASSTSGVNADGTDCGGGATGGGGGGGGDCPPANNCNHPNKVWEDGTPLEAAEIGSPSDHTKVFPGQRLTFVATGGSDYDDYHYECPNGGTLPPGHEPGTDILDAVTKTWDAGGIGEFPNGNTGDSVDYIVPETLLAANTVNYGVSTDDSGTKANTGPLNSTPQTLDVVTVDRIEVVSGATPIADGTATPAQTDICAAVKGSGDVIVRAVLSPDVAEADFPPGGVRWSDGAEVSNHPSQRKVSKAAFNKCLYVTLSGFRGDRNRFPPTS